MEFLLLDEKLKQKYSSEILELMHINDKDFVPALSARNSTTQSGFTADKNPGGLAQYYNEMMGQQILGAICEDVFLGFVSFKENFSTDKIGKNTFPNIYLSTLMLHPQARGQNLTYKMYDYLFNELYGTASIFTRTWSTNYAHIKILSKFGFSELTRIANDRGPGIDTVYFSLVRNPL